MKYNLIIVPHTHWDREWYLPYQSFRIKLVNTLDKILDVLQKNPDFKHFTLDGQTIILEDYLEIRPQNKDKIKKLVKSGKLIIGPWYILPDEFLVSGESIIRNLIIGKKAGEKFGEVMSLGYLPDMFGHIAQMPQILSGFGLECAVVWRGVPREVTTSEFVWRSLSEEEIFTIYLHYGYGNAAELPLDTPALKERLEQIISEGKKFATTSHLLGMNGSDHLPIQEGLPAALKNLDLNVNIEIGNLIKYKDGVLKEVDINKIPQVRGELRSFSHYHLLVGVLSTRMYLKQKHFEVEMLLEKWCEPLSTFCHLFGKKYPREYLSLMWKYFLQNQPHDSICGCSIDEVCEEIMLRYNWIKQIGEVLLKENVDYIINLIDTEKALPVKDKSLIIFNLSSDKRDDIVEVSLPGGSLSDEIEIYDEKGEMVDYQEKIEEGKIIFIAREVPGYGFTTYGIKFTTRKKIKSENHQKEIENEFFKVSVNADSSLKIYDKRNKVTYPVCGQMEDGGDAGDEYNFSPPEKDKIICNPFVFRYDKIENGPARYTLKITSKYYLPKGILPNRGERSKEKVRLTITSYVSLIKGVPRIDFTTEIDNTAKDHRLRVNFIFPQRVEEFITETQFGLVKRETRLEESQLGDLETPIGTYPQKIFTDISGKECGLTLSNKGLPEIEVVSLPRTTKISLTLFRSVGYISRDDLKLRLGHAGPQMETPQAQCLEKNVYHYSLIPHQGDFIKDKTHLLSHNFTRPFLSYVGDIKKGDLPGQMCFLKVEPNCLMVSAVKIAENSDEVIIRLYNISDNIEEGRITLFKEPKQVHLVDLKEDTIDTEPIKYEGRDIIFKIKPQQIKTFRINA